jgi:serine protease Do
MTTRGRNLLFFLLCAALMAPWIAPGVQGLPRTTLILTDGNRITGDLLLEKSDAYVIDLGFEVVSVPKTNVVSRETPGAGESAPTTESDAGGLYHTAPPGELKERTVRDLAAEFGEAVVLVRTAAGLGSGFVINERGYVVTNFHVIANEREISVTLFRKQDGVPQRETIKDVDILALNPHLDLALLEIDVPEEMGDLTCVYLGSSEAARDGQRVFAIGNPLGLERTISEGIISTTRRDFGGQLFVQTTAPINPGNSGGPLFNLNGEVVGVTNMKAGFFTEGLSFAIPVDTLRFFLRNRDVFAYEKDNPNTGFHYLPPPRKPGGEKTADGEAQP